MQTQYVWKRTGYATVEPIWRGETVVCLGGGPSLTKTDVEYCRGKARVIAIKETAVASLPGMEPPAPWADALYACDAKWWQWKIVRGAQHFPGLKYALEPQPYRYPGVHVLRNAGPEGLSTDPSALKTGNNSGYQAINLAVLLGARRILLLGYDCWRGPKNEENWFGPHPNHVVSPYHLFLQRFATLVEPLQQIGVEVINCSRRTRLRAFPQQALEDVL